MEQTDFSGFWQRAGAFIIDCIILGILGLALGQIFYLQLVELGGWGKLIGFTICALYFSILNSSIGNGQTIGKAITGIRVVNINAESISFPTAFLRYSVLGIAFLLNNNMLITDFALTTPVAGVLLILPIFGIPLLSIYLVIFNRATRQTLHDIICNTYVVKKQAVEVNNTDRLWIGHYTASSVILIALLSISVYAYSASQTPTFQNLAKTRADLMKITKVQNISVHQGKHYRNGQNTSIIFTNIILKSGSGTTAENKILGTQKTLALIASSILRNIPDARTHDIIVINFLIGYDIGIAKSWRRHSIANTPQGWQKLINNNINHI